jgi:citrate lyase beta subunit
MSLENELHADPAARAAMEALSVANRALLTRYPGDRSTRQPVHTVYGGAHLFRADTCKRLGEISLQAMATYARDPFEFARAIGFAEVQGAHAELALRYARDPDELRATNHSAWLACAVFERVQSKLRAEPIEDFRIDFEDGFGARPDAEEDSTAHAAAEQVALGLAQNTLPAFLGIRIKSLGLEWTKRSARTLELFLSALLAKTSGKLPENFVITLPKVSHPEQPRALVRMFDLLEKRHSLAPGTLRMELMVEITQALLGPDGSSPLPKLLDACEGRCFAAHFGTYDFTASCSITAAHQQMDHPMCDLAKGMMLLAYAGTGIFLSDGATNVMPVAPHSGASLSAAQLEHNRRVVHSAWQLSHRHISHSLRGGFYQGWDLHPAQLPVRFASCYAFFLDGFAQAAERLRNFVDKAAQATLVGDVFDDAATGQGLLNYFLRARNCGAISDSELASTGLTQEELGLRSFAKILDARRVRRGG